MVILTNPYPPLLDEVIKRERRLHTPEVFKGRGIVTAFGGVRNFTCGYVLIRLLREELKCTLPIEVWHYGEGEITPSMRQLLSPYDVTLVDARSVLANTHSEVQDGWQLKALSILYSSFSELLFLDADQVPIIDPTEVFDFDRFKSSGAVFWPDMLDIRDDNPIWAQLGLENRCMPSFESGQFLIDRTRHISVLKKIVALNEMKDEVYASVYGDKDTFLLGFLLENTPFEIVPHRPFITERALIQRDFDGNPLFQHRTNAKWVYRGKQVRFDGERHGEACQSYLDELKRSWNGVMFYPPDRSSVARSEEAMLGQIGERRMEFVGDRNETIEFLVGHEIGLGRSLDRQNWYVVERNQKLDLIIEANDQIFYVLSKCDDGTWQGHQHQEPSSLVILHEAKIAEGQQRELHDGFVASLVAACDLHHGGEQSHAELRSALTLLLRAEPGVRPSVEALTEMSPALSGIVDLVLEAVPIPNSRAPNKNINTLGTGYQDWRKKAW
jgi:hypothetical protein